MPHKIIPKLYYYFLKGVYFFINNFYLMMNINKLIAKRSRKTPVVLFLIESYQGWIRMRYVHKYMRDVLKYEVIVFISPKIDPRIGWDREQKTIEVSENLKAEGIESIAGFKNGKPIRLEQYMPNFIFVANPYDCLNDYIYDSAHLKQFSHVLYITYGFMLSNTPAASCDINFFDNCSKIYVDSEYMIKRFTDTRGETWTKEKCVLSGQPQLEAFHDKHYNISDYWPRKNNNTIKKILIAPHHTIRNGLYEGDMAAGYSTFLEFKNVYLKLPKLFPNIDFVFRSHPLLSFQLKEFNVMTENEIQDFFATFQSFPNTGLDTDFPDYISIFKTADALITDGISFLAEFLPSGKPIIQTKRLNTPIFNKFGEKVSSLNYNVYTEQELIDAIEDVVASGNDSLYKERMKMVDKNIINPKDGISRLIGEDIREFLANKIDKHAR